MHKCSYKKSFWKYAPAALEDNHAPVYCNFIEIKPQVFCKRDANFNNTLLKEHLWGGGGYIWEVLQPQPTTKAFFYFRKYNLRTQTEYNATFSRFWLLHNKVFFLTKINLNQEKTEISVNKDVFSTISYFKNLVTALTLVIAARIIRGY